MVSMYTAAAAVDGGRVLISPEDKVLLLLQATDQSEDMVEELIR